MTPRNSLSPSPRGGAGGGGGFGILAGNYYRFGAFRSRQEAFLLVLAAATVFLVWVQDSSAPSLLESSPHPGLLSPLSPHSSLRRSSVDDTSKKKKAGRSSNNKNATAVSPGPSFSEPRGDASHLPDDASARAQLPGAGDEADEEVGEGSRPRGGHGSKDSIDPADRSVGDEDLVANAAPANEGAKGARRKPPPLRGQNPIMATGGTSTRPVSPYETRWPDYRLPEWSSKARYGKVPERSVCFVHVGKAAGSSVGCSLGFQLHCPTEFANVTVPGLLPASTTNMMHNDVNDCALDHHYYMFTMRNPVERIKSWWLYDLKQLDRLRKGSCPFRTLNDLAEVGLSQQPYKTTRDCHKMAVAVIRGEQKEGNHAFHNYRWYLQQVPFNASLAVVRAEHLLDDWNAMERQLAAAAAVEGSSVEPTVIRNLPTANENKRYAPEDKYVSELGISWLCSALCDEIQVYKHILGRAVNLQPSDVQQSLQELRETCPHEVDQAACPK